MKSSSQKNRELRDLIFETIGPLVNSNYWILEVPHHANVGDSLIWQGEIEFLNTFPYRCKGMYSHHTFRFPNIPQSDTIFMNGGGSFGDLWEESFQFKKTIIERYPNNRIIFFPQSIFFSDKEKEKEFLKSLTSHPSVIVCTRDKPSYDYLKPILSERALLVPDMAFCLRLKCATNKTCNQDLALVRNDRELRESNAMKAILCRENIITTDWPAISSKITMVFSILLDKATAFPRVIDFAARFLFKNFFIRSGIETISNANHVYTMRMHGAILALLLGKRSSLFDNSYHKCKHFFDTWLSDCDDIELITD